MLARVAGEGWDTWTEARLDEVWTAPLETVLSTPTEKMLTYSGRRIRNACQCCDTLVLRSVPGEEVGRLSLGAIIIFAAFDRFEMARDAVMKLSDGLGVSAVDLAALRKDLDESGRTGGYQHAVTWQTGSGLGRVGLTVDVVTQGDTWVLHLDIYRERR